MKKIYIILTAMLVTLIISCSETSSPYDPSSRDDDSFPINMDSINNNPFISDSNYAVVTDTVIINIIIKIIPGGQIIEKEKEQYRGRWVWKIKVKTKGNGTIEIKIDQKTGKMLHLEGEDGNYDYDIEGLEKFITLMEAFKLATDSVSGVITGWELKYDNEHSWKFEITIITDTGTYKIEIKAEGGIIIEVKMVKKDDGDTDDDDDDNDSTGTDSSEVIWINEKLK